MRKRHEALQSLSHHHHHALVQALKLKRAGTDKSDHSLTDIQSDLEAFWYPGGNEHFREEEEILLPVYCRYASIDQPLIKKILLEHIIIRSKVQQITEVYDPSAELMRDLGQQLTTHVREEEREVFPMIEDALPENELQNLKPYLHLHKDG